MNKVPANRYGQAKMLRATFQESVVVAAVPTPSRMHDVSLLLGQRLGLEWAEEWDEIRGKTHAVSTLVHTRFRNSFFQQVQLPKRIAERLEDFEEGLRLAGLISPNEVLVQSATRPPKFRVQKAQVSDYRHDGNSVVDRSERATHSAVESEDQHKATTPYRRGKRLSSGRYEA